MSYVEILLTMNLLAISGAVIVILRRFREVEHSINSFTSKASNNAIKKLKTPPPIKKKGGGIAYNPSKDIDRMMSGKHEDFW